MSIGEQKIALLIRMTLKYAPLFLLLQFISSAAYAERVTILVDSKLPIAAQHAIDELRSALESRAAEIQG